MDIGFTNGKWSFGVGILPDFLLFGVMIGKAYVNNEPVDEVFIGFVFINVFVRRHEEAH